jgi:hypothetical protein
MTWISRQKLRYRLENRFLAIIPGNHPEEMAYVYRTTGILAIDGLSAYAAVSPVRKSVSWRSLHEIFLMPRSVSLYVLRPAFLQRKFARYWVVLACDAEQAVPQGNSNQSFSKYSCRCKWKPRLAHICRFRSSANKDRKRSIGWWWLRSRTWWDGLCARCINYWSMPFFVSLGTVSKNKGRCKASYPVGSTRVYSHIHIDNRWKSSWCEDPWPAYSGARSILCHGPRVFGLPASLHLKSLHGFLHHSFQGEYEVPTTLFADNW